MATGTIPPPPVSPGYGSDHAGVPRRSARYDQFIDDKIATTRAYVKTVDLAGGLMTLAAGVLVFLFAMAVADHWVISGGLGVWGRLAALAALLVGGGWYLWSRVIPPLLQRVNPLYAAAQIEHTRPSFKNSLLNVLQFRTQRVEVPDAIYRAVERQAATALASAPVDAAVDRSGVIRIGYVLVAVLLVAAMYKVFSPKDPFQTIGRIILPWADIAAPSRVTIESVRPGDGSFVVGRSVEISANITGLSDDEPVVCLYSTADEQIVDHRVPMSSQNGGLRFVCQLPPSGSTPRQDLTYRLEAGDAHTPTYTLAVESAPTIAVRALTYDYPDYTAPLLQDKRVEPAGDIKALEETKVTVEALANVDIGEAWLDLGCDGVKDVRMSVDGMKAQGSIDLRYSDRSNRVPQHSRYQVLFSDRKQRPNEQPVQHAIVVEPDLPPEVEFTAPAKDIEVPENGQAALELKARDPDFALADLTLRLSKQGGGDLPEVSLLPNDKRPHQGQWPARYMFVPRKLGLKSGDVVKYFAYAIDTKTTLPKNEVASSDFRIRIVPPIESKQPQQKQDGNGEGDDPQPKEKTNQDQQPKQKPEPKEQNGDKKQPDGKQADGKENGKGKEKSPEKGQQGKSQPQPKEKAQPGEKQQGGGKERSKQKPEPGQKNDGAGDDEQQPSDQKNPGPGGNEKSKQPTDGAAKQPQPKADGQGGAKQEPSTADKPPDGNDRTDDPSQAAGKPQPTSARKADDGEAIDILKRDAQECNSTGDGSTGAGGKQRPDSKPQADDAKSKPQETQGTGEGTQSSKSKADDKNHGNAKSPPEKAPGEKTEGSRPTPAPGEEKTGEKKAPDDSTKKPGLGNPSKSKTGQGDKGKEGTVDAQTKTQPRRQEDQENSNPAESERQEPQNPSTAKTQSTDSKGQNSGNNSGGGKKSGGQRSNTAGQGSAGTNHSSPDGANTSPEEGDGDDGDQGGDKKEAPGKTGKSGERKGQGSQTKPGEKSPGGTKPRNNAPSPKSDGPEGKQGRQPGKSDFQPGNGSGFRPEDINPDHSNDPVIGDKPNLEHAKKSTDLALEHLRDRMNKGQDEDLLRKLGWTREQAREFLDSWDDLKKNAQQDADAQHKLDQRLQSLGLRPGSDKVQSSGDVKDDRRGLTDGPRVPAPPELSDRIRAYRRGIGESAPARSP